MFRPAKPMPNSELQGRPSVTQRVGRSAIEASPAGHNSGLKPSNPVDAYRVSANSAIHQMLPSAISIEINDFRTLLTLGTLFPRSFPVNLNKISSLRTLCHGHPGWGHPNGSNSRKAAVRLYRSQLQSQSFPRSALRARATSSNAQALRAFYSIAPVIAFRGIDFSLSPVQEDRT
jgi:hypothetical protein